MVKYPQASSNGVAPIKYVACGAGENVCFLEVTCSKRRKEGLARSVPSVPSSNVSITDAYVTLLSLDWSE